MGAVQAPVMYASAYQTDTWQLAHLSFRHRDGLGFQLFVESEAGGSTLFTEIPPSQGGVFQPFVYSETRVRADAAQTSSQRDCFCVFNAADYRGTVGVTQFGQACMVRRFMVSPMLWSTAQGVTWLVLFSCACARTRVNATNATSVEVSRRFWIVSSLGGLAQTSTARGDSATSQYQPTLSNLIVGEHLCGDNGALRQFLCYWYDTYIGELFCVSIVRQKLTFLDTKISFHRVRVPDAVVLLYSLLPTLLCLICFYFD